MKNCIDISDMAYNPPTLTVKCGECVTWTNCDDVAHTVTDDGQVTRATVDSGDIAPGASYDRTFSAVGTFPYHCAKMPEMKGVVTVE